MPNDFDTQGIPLSQPKPRRSLQARVRWLDHVVTVGGDAPVRVQSMTNTDTVDAVGTAIQIKELALAGSEMVRLTVNTPEAAVPSTVTSHVPSQSSRGSPLSGSK